MLQLAPDGLDRIFIPCNLHTPYQGSPVMGGSSTNLRLPYMLFDPSGSEGAYALIPAIPTNWIRASLYLWTVTTTAPGPAYVMASISVGYRADGGLSTASHSSVFGNVVPVLITNVAFTVQRHAIVIDRENTRRTLGDQWQCIMQRLGGDASDSYAADIGYVALELVRTA